MIYLKTINEIFANPVGALMKAKKEKNIEKTLIILVVDWVLLALSFLLVGSNFLYVYFMAMMIFSLGITGSIFVALLAKFVFNILGGKGGYFEALTPLAYSELPISVGFLLAGIISLIPYIGMILTVVPIAIFAALGIPTFYRGIKEMFGLDMITTLVGISILAGVMIISFYASMLLYGLSSPNLISLLMRA